MYSRTIRQIFETYYAIKVGMYTQGAFALNLLPAGTVVGRYCSLYYSMRAFNANHPMNLRSTHALFYNKNLGLTDRDLITRPPLVIGNDVLIGHNAVILPSVRSIGDGAVIGSSAIVNRNVPPYAVVVGHPAMIVRYRFKDETIKTLLESKWWMNSVEQLKLNLDEFQRPLEGGVIR